MGEISPRLHGRSDVEQFGQSCEEITNMRVYPQGGADRRPGTQYLSNAMSAVEYAKQFAFSKSKTENYVIIFTLDLTTGNGIKIWDVANKVFIDVNTVGYNDTDYPTYSRWEGFNTPTELQEIQSRPFGNVAFFSQKDHPPFALDFSTTAIDSTVYVYPFWAYSQLSNRSSFGTPSSVTNLQIADAWPYQDRNSDTGNAIHASATTGNISLIVDASVNFIFLPSHIGSLFRMTGDSAATSGVALITGYVSEEEVTAKVLRAFEDTNQSSVFSLSSWSEYMGWPKAITLFENRVVYGFSNVEPNTGWASKIGNVSFMRQEQYIDEVPFAVTNSDAWSFTVAIDKFNTIQWLSAGKTLFLGSLGAEAIGFGPDATLSMGPLNFQFKSDTSYGSSQIQPIRRDNILIFVQRSGKMLRELTFNFDEDAYKAPKIMGAAEHMPRKTQSLVPNVGLFSGQIVEMAHQESNNQITWYRDSHGGIFGMTRDRDADGQPTAFHYHQIAGWTPQTPGAKILSICVCPSSDSSHDDIYLMVRRAWDVGGVFPADDRTYFEKIGREYEHESIFVPEFTDIDEKPIYLDSAKVSSIDQLDPAKLVHSGFDHLYQYGGIVHVIADGHYVGPKVVNSSGEITLETAAREVIAGMYYRSQIIPVQLNMGSLIGTSQGADKTSDDVTIRFVRTIGGKLLVSLDEIIDEGQAYEIEFRDPNAAQNDPIEIFTGDKTISPPLGFARKVNIVIRQDLPFPQHVACIVSRGVAND